MIYTDRETLAMRNGYLFVRCQIADFNKPVMYINYWPIGVSFYDLASRLGTEQAQSRIGNKLQHLGNGVFRDEHGLSYRTINGAQTKPEITETEAIPEPVQRGKKLETRWNSGYWQKYSQTKGWIRA